MAFYSAGRIIPAQDPFTGLSARPGVCKIKEQKKNILVTGATGFVGQVLCRAAITEDWNIRALLRDPASGETLPLQLQAAAVAGNMLDTESLHDACAGIDTILHLAGDAHVGANQNDPLSHSLVVGAENLLSAALAVNVRRIVFVSSSLAQSAEMDRGDVTDYGKSKLAAERLLSDACKQGKIELVILRPVNVYGLGMKGNIAGMIAMILKGRLPPLPKLSSRISLLGVQDLAQAIILAARVKKAEGQIYTITDGESYAVSEIEGAIYQISGRPMPTWRTPAVLLYAASAAAGLLNKIGLRKSSISTRTYQNLMNDNLFDNEKACQELGFEPSTTLYKALPEIIENIVSTSHKA